MTGKAKPRTVKVKAWAVVCADGRIRTPSDPVFYRSRADAASRARVWDRYNLCGQSPHTVVPLTGTFTPKRRAR